jgi:hypothetical protein
MNLRSEVSKVRKPDQRDIARDDDAWLRVLDAGWLQIAEDSCLIWIVVE